MRGYAPVSAFPGEKPTSILQRRPRALFILLIASVPALALFAWLGQDKIPNWYSSIESIEAGGDGWEYVDSIDKETGLQRLSWGALEEQGAKSSIRKNLRGDKGYLFSMYGAG